MATRNMGREGINFFVGVVEDTADPKMLGRVRVRFHGQHSNGSIATTDLPWATPLMPIFSAALKGVGMSPTGVQVGSQVFGFCLDGYEGQIPLIWGTYNKMSDGQNDLPGLATGNNTITQTVDGPEPQSAYAAQYPHNTAWVTKSGHAIEVDDTPGHERLRFYHKAGSYNETNETGRMVTKTMDDAIEIDVKNKIVWVKSDYKVQVLGNYTMNVAGDYVLQINGKMTANVGDLVTYTSGKDYTVNSKGKLIANSASDMSLNSGAGTTIKSGQDSTITSGGSFNATAASDVSISATGDANMDAGGVLEISDAAGSFSPPDID